MNLILRFFLRKICVINLEHYKGKNWTGTFVYLKDDRKCEVDIAKHLAKIQKQSKTISKLQVDQT